MGYRKRMGAAALAAFGLLAAQPALAQRCIAPQDVTDTGIYAVPILAEGFRASCTPYLAEDGFFATRGEAFVAPYASIQSDRWPGAFRTFMALANGREDDGTAAMLSDLPPETLRPIVDAFLAQKIEQAMELLAPLPPENFGGLLTFILDVTDVKEPGICPAEQP
ncbi:hypothetical protein [Qipengyuania citrea]|nr:hypothetical protein [Qipengyuania citrea]MDQ0565196.1 hypothetical protein [Qipengyuania citrea]